MGGLSPLQIVAILVGAYLLGSIPFGVIASRLGGLGDIRKVGSGNIGATNVLRTGRRDLALITLIGDGGKGAVAVLLASLAVHRLGLAQAGAAASAIAGAAAFLGHIFPVWLGFRGGKGVATFFGVLLAAFWPVGILAGATWIGVFALTRISSLSALTAAVAAPVLALLFHAPAPLLALTIGLGLLIYLRHHENIGRLLKGQEPKFSGSKSAPGAAAP